MSRIDRSVRSRMRGRSQRVVLIGFDDLGDRKKRALKKMQEKGKGVIYDPGKLLRKIAPKSKIDKMLGSRVTLKKSAMSFLDDVEFLDKGAIAEVALKTIASYKDRIAEAGDELKDEILDDPKQLIQRVQNEVILQIGSHIKDQYHGEFYTWLPSEADDPRPEHQLNYGKIFQVGDGEMPGDAIGCQCGMQILVNDDQLNLEG